MEKEHPIHVSRITHWSWAKRFMTFLGVFGGTWALLEPLFAVFGEPGPLAFLGLWRYACLVIFAFGITVFVEILERRRFLGRLSFIQFTIVLMESGARYLVEAPEDMRAEDFVELFMKKVSHNAPPKSLLARSDMYVNSLMIPVGNRAYREHYPLQSLKENGIRNGSVCKILGRILEIRANVVYGPLFMVEKDETVEATDDNHSSGGPQDMPSQ